MKLFRALCAMAALAFTVAPASAYQDSLGANVPPTVPIDNGTGTPMGTSANPMHTTAVIGGFQPTPGYATLSVGLTSSRVVLPTGTSIVVYNTGTNAAFVQLGNSSVTATASNDVITPGCWMAFTVGSAVDLAAIETAGATSLIISGGSGLPTGACAAGSGGGGGSNASVGSNGSTGPSSSTLAGSLDGSGNLQPASAANPIPVTSASDQTLTATGTISAADTAATATSWTNNQTILTWSGTPTTGSNEEFPGFTGAQTGVLICYGSFSGTFEFDTEMDNASPAHYVKQTITSLTGGASPDKTGSFPGPIMGKVNLAGAIGGRIRATASPTGSPTCTLRVTGNLSDVHVSNLLPPGQDARINLSTSTTGTAVVVGVAGQSIRVSMYEFIAGGTTNFSFGSSTSSSCTSITILAGPWPLNAQAGEAPGSGVASILTVPAGDTLCEVSTGGSVAVGGHVHYTQY